MRLKSISSSNIHDNGPLVSSRIAIRFFLPALYYSSVFDLPFELEPLELSDCFSSPLPLWALEGLKPSFLSSLSWLPWSPFWVLEGGGPLDCSFLVSLAWSVRPDLSADYYVRLSWRP